MNTELFPLPPSPTDFHALRRYPRRHLCQRFATRHRWDKSHSRFLILVVRCCLRYILNRRGCSFYPHRSCYRSLSSPATSTQIPPYPHWPISPITVLVPPPSSMYHSSSRPPKFAHTPVQSAKPLDALDVGLRVSQRTYRGASV